jgi:membrane associated rhomboid family serine protease
MRCGACQTALEDSAQHGLVYQRCPKCGRIRVAMAQVPRVQPADLTPPPTPEPRGACGGCGRPMHATLFRAIPTIRLDRCPRCEVVEAESLMTLALVDAVFEKQALHALAQRAGEEIAHGVKRNYELNALAAEMNGRASPVLPSLGVLKGRPGPGTLTLTAMLLIGFVLPAFLRQSGWDALVLQPAEVRHGAALHGLVTSLFLHAGCSHLLGNGLMLLIFATGLERRVGGPALALLFFTCGAIASLGHVVARLEPALGASGSIAGLMGAYLVLCRESYRNLVYAAIWLVSQLVIYWVLRAQHSQQLSSVAWEAHLVGFTAGVAAGVWWGRRARQPAPSRP